MISDDAIVFGFAYLNGPKCKLSFGGDGAELGITQLARAALNELLQEGFAEIAEANDSIPNREHYQGKGNLGPIVKARGFNPLTEPEHWVAFERIELISKQGELNEQN